MVENEEDDRELIEHAMAVDEAVHHKNYAALLGHISMSLVRIAKAQEHMSALSQIDLEATIEAAVEERAEQKAADLDKARTTRTYIGKKR